MITRAKHKGLGFKEADYTRLTSLIYENMDTFGVSFFSSYSGKVRNQRIQLKDDAKPVCARLRKYSDEQGKFLRNMMSRLL